MTEQIIAQLDYLKKIVAEGVKNSQEKLKAISPELASTLDMVFSVLEEYGVPMHEKHRFLGLMLECSLLLKESSQEKYDYLIGELYEFFDILIDVARKGEFVIFRYHNDQKDAFYPIDANKTLQEATDLLIGLKNNLENTEFSLPENDEAYYEEPIGGGQNQSNHSLKEVTGRDEGEVKTSVILTNLIELFSYLEDFNKKWQFELLNDDANKIKDEIPPEKIEQIKNVNKDINKLFNELNDVLDNQEEITLVERTSTLVTICQGTVLLRPESILRKLRVYIISLEIEKKLTNHEGIMEGPRQELRERRIPESQKFIERAISIFQSLELTPEGKELIMQQESRYQTIMSAD